MGETPNSDWMSRWQALTRPWFSAWQDGMHAGGAASAPAGPDGFEQWARLFSAGGGGQGETIERVVESAKAYTAFMQSMLAALSSAPDNTATWGDALRQGFTAQPGSAALFEHPAVRAWRDAAGGQRHDAMAQFMKALGALRPTSPPMGDLRAPFELPAFGPLREHQEHYQKSALAWLDYQEQLGRYGALMLEAAQRGFARFEGKLAEREQPGRQIESLRALYDLWVDAAEEAYAEVALSVEFREVYAALVNAQMRVRAQLQQEVERISTDLGMPTRSEIDSIGKRLQALRREVRAQGGNAALAAELAALRAEFAAFKAAAARPPASAPPPKPRRRTSAAPAAAAAPAPAQRAARPARPRPAAAASDSFASRIEQYAKHSLGAPRKHADSAANAGTSKKKTRR